MCSSDISLNDSTKWKRLSKIGLSLAASGNDLDACHVEEDIAVNSITELEFPTTEPETQTQPEISEDTEMSNEPENNAEAEMEEEEEPDINEAATESAAGAATESAASGDEATTNRCEDTAPDNTK